MKITYLFSLCMVTVLIGCSSQGDSAAKIDPSANSTPDQQIEKIKNDPNIPDGLKKIQTETLQAQPGVKR